MKKQIRVGIAEDHDILRQGLVSLFESYPAIKIVFSVGNGKELLDKISLTKPDVILLDLEMPVVSGKEAFEIIRKEHSGIRIIIISASFQKLFVLEYIKKGVNAFLPKNCGIEVLVQAITAVHETGRYYSDEVSQMLVMEVSEELTEEKIEFSESELAIIKLICEDKASKEIGDILSLSPRTVEWHRSSILRKINAKSVSALIRYAYKHKIVEL